MSDPEAPELEQPSFAFRRRYFYVSSVVLLVLIGLTWGVGLLSKARLSDEISNAQLTAVQSALDEIEREFRSIQDEMVQEARALASDSRLVNALRRTRTDDIQAEEELIRMLAAYKLPENGAVEVYDQQPRLVGWAGTSVPLDSAPSEANFLDSFQSSLAFDGDRHSALVIWTPVKDGIETVGAVRILRMIVRHVPIRNEFLRDYTLEEEWSRATRLVVRVELNPRESFDPSTSRYSRMLQGADGRTLIRVRVEPPTEEDLVAMLAMRYSDIMYGWVTLGLLILLLTVGRWAIQNKPDDQPLTPLARFGILIVVAVSTRASFLLMDIPGRWQTGKAPFSALFDPGHFASGFGYGIMRTSGDLLVSALFILYAAVLFIRITESARISVLNRFQRTWVSLKDQASVFASFQVFAAATFHTVILMALLTFYAAVSRQTVLDSTLDYFERSGLLPHRLVLLVFGALLLLTVAIVFFCSRSLWVSIYLLAPKDWTGISRIRAFIVALAAVFSTVAVTYLVSDVSVILPLKILVLFLFLVYVMVYFSPMREDRGTEWLHLRSIVPSVVLVSMVLYPVLENGMEVDRQLEMEEAASSFEEELSTRVKFAIGQVLNKVDGMSLDMDPDEDEARVFAHYDSVASALKTGELLSSLGTHDVSIIVFSDDGRPIGRYEEDRRRGTRESLNDADREIFGLIYEMYGDQEEDRPLIEKMTGDREQFVYAGFAPMKSNNALEGWVLIRAIPREIAREGAQAFPRVLVESGYYGDHYADMSLAEFLEGVMIQNFGTSFGRYNLDPEIVEILRTESVFWQREKIRDRDYVTMYRRIDPRAIQENAAGPGSDSAQRIVAVRIPDISFFNHLYFLLRITVAGLILGLPVYLLGVLWRRAHGQLPAPQVHFQDKVLNAFFVVGLVTVTVTGWVGWQVVTGENERAVESWLRQHLFRVEEALNGDIRGDELAYRVLERTDLDSLTARVGLDLNIYRASELERTSRPQLLRDRLIDVRLPVEAYEALFYDGFRFVSVDQSLGSFYYTAGYLALTDETGTPKYVVSLPTLPEQERIEEERARTVAYLFGALLLLVLVVMVTASLLANALSRPIARLRAGLLAVSAGHFESIGPIKSRDEIGDLVDSFNTMQEQLVESRELLAKQERQLAWREMARQVAHEIKNPLTPMKLSIQHLRTAFSRMIPSDAATEGVDRDAFETKFNRTTTTLIEQINALARIADGFSSFGSMPQPLRESLDLNREVEAAANLMRNETDTAIETDLSLDPLVVEGDREAIRRLFINLIKNAIQAIPDDRSGLIKLSTERIERDGLDWASATVTDNGIGISESLWEKVFVPSFSTKTSGTGLGLAIAQKTIEDLGGEISFETVEDEGTSFRILLRLRNR